ncbi:retrovirus-related pol polyprotein from transposon TNT 1-94, partial [Tanacetum coccineum]
SGVGVDTAYPMCCLRRIGVSWSVKLNEPSSAPAKGKKSSSASKVNSALAGKLKSVKIKDYPPLATVMKELNDLKLQISKNQSSYSRSNKPQQCDIRKPIWYLGSRCSRHMTGVKSYLHKYVEQPGPKVVFRDDSTCVTEGYSSIKCNGIVFTKVAFVNGLKYNLISISQLCDAKYIVQFDEKRGTIFNSNKEIVMIAPRVRDVYVLDMTSSEQESCNLGILSKEEKNSILVSFCDEKGISQNFSSPYTPGQNWAAERKNRTLIESARTMLSGSVFSKQYWNEVIATACYTQNRYTIVKRHLKTPYEIFRGKIPNINFLHVFGCPIYIHKHKYYLGRFDKKADNGYFLGYSLVSKAFRVFNTRKQQTKETYHITFDESTNAIKFSIPSIDNINIAESERYPPDEYIHHYEPYQKYQVNINEVSFIDPYERSDPIENDIPNDNPPEHSNHNNDSLIIENIINAEAVQDSKLTSSSVEDASAQNTILIPNSPSSSIPSTISPVAQDRWSQDKHIKLIKQAKRGISINQEKYVKDLLKKYDINGSSVKTPIVPPNNLGPDLNGKSVNKTQFKGMIGSLMYLTASRPDIQFSTCLCAIYQANPKESHLIDVKRIFTYLKGTLCLGLWKTTSGACQLLGGKLVFWSAKKQQYVTMSSSEAEYAASAGCCANILWMKSHSLTMTSYMKRDHILKGDIELHFIPTQYQLADIFTKPQDDQLSKD